ncbi:hypothetical protein GGF38_003244 [Coemansia sp. RSA 25]|nr:hypothetical protein GGF38_003244 [Coemansia sp. RSA 25]
MADIERQILQQVDCDEDDAERSRARENGDDESIPLDARAEGTMPTSTHDGPQTGAKGVVADYRHARREQRQRMEREAVVAKADYAAAVAMRDTHDSSGGQALWVKDEADSKCDDMDDDDLFFEEYRRKRMAELSHAAEQTLADALIDATPSEYVEIVDRETNSGAPVVVVLVNNSAVSRRLEGFIRAAAPKYALATFVRVQAADCGFVDSELVPIVLVYRHGELEHNMVRVVDRLRDSVSFEQRDVTRLLATVLQR